MKDYIHSKIKRVDGDFKHSYTNQKLRSEFRKIQVEQKKNMPERSPALKSVTDTNYSTFLSDKDELPRLSILTNYN